MTTKKPDFDLSDWTTFVDSVHPIPKRSHVTHPRLPTKQTPLNPKPRTPPKPRLKVGSTSGVQARIDLHGYTEQTVFPLLEDFIERCIQNNIRCILIVTGKGQAQFVGQFLLRQEVPRFLSTPKMAKHILQIQQAPRQKGGEGALIVHLRKPTELRPRKKKP